MVGWWNTGRQDKHHQGGRGPRLCTTSTALINAGLLPNLIILPYRISCVLHLFSVVIIMIIIIPIIIYVIIVIAFIIVNVFGFSSFLGVLPVYCPRSRPYFVFLSLFVLFFRFILLFPISLLPFSSYIRIQSLFSSSSLPFSHFFVSHLYADFYLTYLSLLHTLIFLFLIPLVYSISLYFPPASYSNARASEGPATAMLKRSGFPPSCNSSIVVLNARKLSFFIPFNDKRSVVRVFKTTLPSS